MKKGRKAGVATKRPRGGSLLPLLVLAFLTACIRGGSVTTENNVLVILIDCLRADHVSAYGYERETTPALDALAMEAVTFRQAITQSTFTKTSVASLFTGRNAYRHGVYSGSRKDEAGQVISDVLGAEEVTLAEALTEAGYLSVGLLQQAHLRDYMGFGQGFEDYDADAGNVERINERFLMWLDGRVHDRPWFAYLHYIDIHDPYRPRKPYDSMFGEYKRDVYSGFDLENWGQELADIRQGRRPVEESEVEQFRAYYDGLIRYVDDQMGVLLEELEERGVFDNTLIIVTSDHGDGFMEHGFLSHSTKPYEELIRVPLVMRFPKGRLGGREISRQVRLIDVMPTILDWAGLRPPSGLDGVSMLPLAREDSDVARVRFPRLALTETAYGIGQTYPWVSIRTEALKYHHRRNPEGDELYDLTLDPGEKVNLAASRPEEVSDLRRRALAIVHQGWSRDREETVVDDETVKQLKALGYLK